MPHPPLSEAIQSVPAGAWAVGVSGGADSVAFLGVLRARSDLALHVVHLDHQARGADSTADAEFVRQLAAYWNLPLTIMRRDQIEPHVTDLPSNLSARFRKLRLTLFQRVVRENSLQGVILAHHADDQAETVFHRLLRSSGAIGLAGMTPRTTLAGLVILRPLLSVPREKLREYLRSINQPWRVDASNESQTYLRNRLRRILARSPKLTAALLDLGEAIRSLRDWARQAAPRLEPQFRAEQLAKLPDLLARESAKDWLVERGVPANEIDMHVIERLVTMSRDAASPARRHFPGRILIRRHRGVIASV